MTTILVAGATGFVGGHTLRYVARQPGIRLIAACRDRARLPAGFAGEVREGDLRDRAYLERLLDGVDVVVNAAAWSSLLGSEKDSERLYLKPATALADAYFRSEATRLVNVSSTSAAAPDHSADAMAPGIMRPFWPHLCNVVRIENHLRDRARADKSVVNMRLGVFVGEHYSLGLLPILVPRMKTHLVPWVGGGKTHLPLLDGRDCGQAMGRAVLAQGIEGYQSFNIVGAETPTVRDVMLFLAREFGLPEPLYGVSFPLAYAFAWLMEKLDPIVPWDPLIVRSIVFLLEETNTDNERARRMLGYAPRHDWREAIRLQFREMAVRETTPMPLAKPVS